MTASDVEDLRFGQRTLMISSPASGLIDSQHIPVLKNLLCRTHSERSDALGGFARRIHGILLERIFADTKILSPPLGRPLLRWRRITR